MAGVSIQNDGQFSQGRRATLCRQNVTSCEMCALSWPTPFFCGGEMALQLNLHVSKMVHWLVEWRLKLTDSVSERYARLRHCLIR